MNTSLDTQTALHRSVFLGSSRLPSISILALIAALVTALPAWGKQPSALALDSPASGDVLYVGDKVPIRWEPMTAGAMRISYSTDGGNTWMSVVPDNGTVPSWEGIYEWTVPDTPSELVKVKLAYAEHPEVAAIATPLMIRRAAVTILSPNGGEAFKPGAPITVTWSESNTSALRIEYSNDNGVTWHTLADLIAPELGSYSVTPPATPTTFAHIRIVDVARDNVLDLSDHPFSLVHMAGVDNGVASVSGERILGSFPNPFAERTEIRWTQSAGADVELRVYEQTGRLVAVHDVGRREPGMQRWELRAGELAAGVYIYELRLGERTLRSTLVVTR